MFVVSNQDNDNFLRTCWCTKHQFSKILHAHDQLQVFKRNYNYLEGDMIHVVTRKLAHFKYLCMCKIYFEVNLINHVCSQFLAVSMAPCLFVCLIAGENLHRFFK